MDIKPKFKVIVYYFSEIMRDVFERQIRDTFYIGDRHVVTGTTSLKNSESGDISKFDELGTFQFIIQGFSKFIPYVTYARRGKIISTDEACGDNSLLAVVIIEDYEEEKMYDRVGEFTHMQFKGLQDYIDSKIVINVDEEPGECRVYFFKDSEFYPVVTAYCDYTESADKRLTFPNKTAEA